MKIKKLLLSISALAILLGMPSFARAAEGDLLWSREMSHGYEGNDPKFIDSIGPGAYSMAIGDDGFIYAAAAPFYSSNSFVLSQHYRVAKFDANGVEKFNTTFTDGNFLYISDIEVDDSGLYLLGGSYIPGDPYGDMQWDIMKVSKDNANILWRKQYNPAVGKATGGVRIDYAHALYSDGSDIYVLGDYNLYGFDWSGACGLSPCAFTGSEGVGLYKLNKSTGKNDSWSDKWSGGSVYFTNMTHVSDVVSDGTSLYINGADIYGGYSFFQKMDKNGNLIWRKYDSTDASADYSSAHHLIEYDSATNAFYRVYWDGNSIKNILQKVDTSGNVLFTKNFDHNDGYYDPPVGIAISGDYLVLASLNMLGKYDKNGVKIWSQQKGDWRNGSYQGALGVKSDGIYVSHVTIDWGAYDIRSTIKKYSTTPPTPVAPTNLTATTHTTCDTGQINLTWNSVSGAAGYDTRIDGGAWINRGNVTSYSYPGLAAASVHTFEVRAWNGAGAGVASASVSGTAPALCGTACVADTWTGRTPAVDNNWQSVTYGNGLFVAVSTNGTGNRVMTSPDGITWTLRTSAANKNWLSVTYGNGLFVAVSGGGVDTSNRVMTSPDGITWTGRTAASNSYWQSVTYGNGLFVAVACGVGSQASCNANVGNRVMTSSDGITWTLRTTTGNNYWQSVTYGNGLFVATPIFGGGTGFMTSPDGITWTLRTTPAASNNWTSVTYGNGLFVAVADSGTGNRVLTSSDGITWTSRASAADNSWYSVTYGNGLFVAVSLTGVGSRVMTSPDGITWTLRTSPAGNQWRSIAYGNSLFTAIDPYGNVMTAPCAAVPAPTLKICIGSIYLGKATVSGTTLTTRTIPTIGNSETLKAWNGTDNNTCDGTDVTPTTTWSEESGNTAVDVTGINTANVTITAKAYGSETVSIPNATASPRISIPYNIPAPSCTSNCNAEKGNHCQGETFTTNDSCGVSETCTNAGTRYCDMNWKEVAPGN